MAEIINTFENGVNKENDFPFQPKGTVRDAVNFRVIANKEGSSVSVQDVEGNVNVFDLLPGYIAIGWTFQENELIIFSTNNPIGPFDGNGAIAVVNTNTNTINHIYNHQDLNFNDNHQIEAIAVKEVEDIKRSYFTDFYNSPRVIDYGILQNYQNIPSGSLVNGTKYMVVQGDIIYNGINYGVTHTTITPNNTSTIFTATATTTYTVINGPVKIIEYYNIANLFLVPEMDLGNIKYRRRLLTGGLLHGGYCYAYQLETESGFRTNWSYITDMINIAGPNDQTDTIAAYNNYQGNASTISTGRSIVLEISNIDTNFKKINVAYIHYTALNSASSPVVFESTDITSSTMTITHSGMLGRGITFDDLIQSKVNIKKAKTLTSLKNKLFFGNIEYNKVFNVDARSGVVFTKNEYSVPSDYGDDTTSYNIRQNSASLENLIGHPAVDSSMVADGVTNNVILTDQWYEVLSGTVNNNDGTPYTAGQYFQGSTFLGAFATGGGTYRAVIRIQKYGTTYEYIPIEGEYLDNKGVAVSHYLKGYWRDETYRTAILLYTPTFEPMFALWMGDYRMPDQSESPIIKLINRANLVHLGMKFSNISIFRKVKEALEEELGVSLTYNDLTKYIGGWSIVRARRDEQIFGQGLVHPTMVHNDDLPNQYVRPAANVSTYNNFNGINSKIKNYRYIWNSPEVLFNHPTIMSKLAVDGVELKITSYLGIFGSGSSAGLNDPANAFGYIESQDGSTDYGWYRKYYLLLPRTTTGYIDQNSGAFVPGLTPNTYTPINMGNKLIPNTSTQAWNILGFPNTSYNIGNTSELFYARSRMYSAGPWISSQIQNPVNKTLMVSTTFAEGSYPNYHFFGVPYYASTQISTYRALANLVIPKSNLYGGQSEIALANTRYIYCNHFQKMDTAFINYLTSTNGIVNNVDVWGGDCFVSIFGHNRIMKEEPASGANETIAFSEIFPVESNINTFLSEGKRFVKHGTFGPLKTQGISYSDPAIPEDYIYNYAYSSEESYLDYPALPQDFSNNSKFPTRIIYSKTKTLGETIDNYRVFLPNQFRDIEAWPGHINNIKGKGNYIFYWQPQSVGYAPVNERATISNTLGAPIVLGQTGVLDRFDDITLFYGNRHQWSLCETETHFVWFDISKRAVCYMPLNGGAIQEVSLQKGYRSHFDNTVPFFENDKNVVGNGIHAHYDSKLKEVMFIISGFFFNDEDNYYCFTFSMINFAFSGSFKCKAGMLICINNRVFVQPMSPKSYAIIAGSKDYKEGDLLSNNVYTAVYICKQDYTSALMPIDPSLDNTNWQKLFDCNEIFEQNIGDIAMFFRKVYPSELEIVVPAPNQMPVVFDNLRWNTRNQNFFDRIKYLTSDQSAEDIVTNDVQGEYYFQNKQWYNNIPFHDFTALPVDTFDSGRMHDSFLRIIGKKFNRDGGFLKSLNKKMILSMLLTKFRPLK